MASTREREKESKYHSPVLCFYGVHVIGRRYYRLVDIAFFHYTFRYVPYVLAKQTPPFYFTGREKGPLPTV